MSERETKFEGFLNSTRWATWKRAQLAIDASSRAYIRLSQGNETVIAMDAPPAFGEDVRPFITIAEILCKMNLAAPRILAKDVENGFLILDDLGPISFAAHLKKKSAETRTLYRSATDVLIHIHNQETPKLTQLTPDVAGDMVQIVTEHYVDAPNLTNDLVGLVSQAMQANCGPANHLALRDFHAENLIWRPTKQGHDRVGLLDFQDAFFAPAGYDLASFLRDARRDVPSDISNEMVAYFARQTHTHIKDMKRAIATLSVQRNLRILGVFARLIRVANKQRYAAMLPRVWTHILSDLQHPDLAELRALVETHIPSPKDAGFS